MVRGAVRTGKSLLAGLLRCGQCGRRLHVAYGGKHSVVPRYHCRGALINHGADGCISFGGWRVDQAVEKEVLTVLEPGAIEAAITATTARHHEREQRRRAVELELREAEYTASRAQRQYDAVEPENRLVAETLARVTPGLARSRWRYTGSGCGRTARAGESWYSWRSSSVSDSASIAAHSNPTRRAARSVRDTTPILTPRLAATWRWLRCSAHFCRRISRALRMDSLSAATSAPLPGADGALDHPASLRSVRRPPLLGGHGRLFTFTDLGVHGHRSGCSRCRYRCSP